MGRMPAGTTSSYGQRSKCADLSELLLTHCFSHYILGLYCKIVMVFYYIKVVNRMIYGLLTYLAASYFTEAVIYFLSCRLLGRKILWIKLLLTARSQT